MIALRRAGALLLLLLATLVASAAPAGAVERVTSFVSDVLVERNGDLQVTETIVLNAEGDQIQRGFLRDFPTTYRTRDGREVVVGFDVRSVARDGSPEPYSKEKMSNGVRLRIGRADALLSTGLHEYVIKYRTTRQIGYYTNFDELYWNANGNGWTFLIDVAEARITLPERVPFTRKAVYTGRQGSTANDATIVEDTPGRIVFRTTRALPALGSLTVAVGWPKGVLLPPPGPGIFQRVADWITGSWLFRNLPLVLALIGLPLVLGYYAYAWIRIGAGPRRGTVIPLFTPPEGMSAAATRYVRRMGFDDKTFTAALLELAVNGHLRLIESGKKRISMQRRPGGKPVGAAEQAAEDSLFHTGSLIPLTRGSRIELNGAMTTLGKAFKKKYEDVAFSANTSWAVWGLLATIGLMIVIVAANWTQEGDVFSGTLFTLLFPMPAVMGGFAFLAAAWNAQGRDRIVLLIFGLLIGGGGTWATLWIFFAVRHEWGAVMPAFAAFALAPLAVLAFPLFKVPTAAGRKLMDAIDGFRLYLGTAEEDRLQAFYPPKKTPELFEQYLPYAVALDVENAWAKRFEGIIESSMLEEVEQSWYSGDRRRLTDATRLTDFVSDTLSTTIASASTPPGSSGERSGSSSDESSSGSGGGGSAGGGGGGGGGSGW